MSRTTLLALLFAVFLTATWLQPSVTTQAPPPKRPPAELLRLSIAAETPGLAGPFKGITTNGQIESGLFGHSLDRRVHRTSAPGGGEVCCNLAFGLMRASLSAKGMKQTRDIMHLNETLAELAGNNFDEYGEWQYYITLMGTPSAGEPGLAV